MYTVQHFKKMGCKEIALYHVMGLVDAGESTTQREGQGRLRKLTKVQEKRRRHSEITVREGLSLICIIQLIRR